MVEHDCFCLFQINTTSGNMKSARSERRLRLSVAKQLAAESPCKRFKSDSSSESSRDSGSDTEHEEATSGGSNPTSGGEDSLSLTLTHRGSESSSLDLFSGTGGHITKSDSSIAGSQSETPSPISSVSCSYTGSQGSPSLSSISSLSYSEDDSDQSSSNADGYICNLPTEPLFPNSVFTEYQFNVSMASVAQRHNMSYSCMTDVLRLISLYLPSPNSAPQSAKTLLSQFVDTKRLPVSQMLWCLYAIAKSMETCDQDTCKTEDVPNSKFVEVPLDRQLQQRFKGIISDHLNFHEN